MNIFEKVISYQEKRKSLYKREKAFKWLDKAYDKSIGGNGFTYLFDRKYPSTLLKPIETIYNCFEALDINMSLCGIQGINFNFKPYNNSSKFNSLNENNRRESVRIIFY